MKTEMQLKVIEKPLIVFDAEKSVYIRREKTTLINIVHTNVTGRHDKSVGYVLYAGNLQNAINGAIGGGKHALSNAKEPIAKYKALVRNVIIHFQRGERILHTSTGKQKKTRTIANRRNILNGGSKF